MIFDSRNGSYHLNCELGMIAMTKRTKFSVNRGIIVRIEDSFGLMHWPEFHGLVHVWQVRVLTVKSALCYYLPRRSELKHERIGLVPDRFLTPLTPVTGQLRFEFEDYEPEPDLEPTAL